MDSMIATLGVKLIGFALAMTAAWNAPFPYRWQIVWGTLLMQVSITI